MAIKRPKKKTTKKKVVKKKTVKVSKTAKALTNEANSLRYVGDHRGAEYFNILARHF